MFSFYVPGRTVRREVADVIAAADARERAAFGAISDIGEMLNISDFAIRAVGSDDLLRIAIERVDAQRHSIIEDAEASANDCLVMAERSPGHTNARRDTKGFSDALSLKAHACIE